MAEHQNWLEKMEAEKKMRVLVTGGAGFIGSHVSERLAREGFDVRVFDLFEQFKGKKLSKGTSPFYGSILDSTHLSQAIKGCDYVVHLAAMLGVKNTELNRLNCLTINAQGTINVLDACVKENVKKIVFSSSSEVYGEQTNFPITENSELKPKSVYGLTKAISEEYLKAYKQRYGLDYSVVRFFNVYGPNQPKKFVVSRFVDSVLNDKSPVVYGNGGKIRAFCNVEDAAEGVLLALTKNEANSRVFNICNASEPISMKMLAEKVIELSGKNLNPELVAMENSDRTEAREIFKRVPSGELAKKVLGFEAKVSLNEGLKKILDAGK